MNHLDWKIVLYLCLSFVIWPCMVSICLLWRFIICRFGKKIQSDPKKAILITGSTSGFGLALAKFYHNLGFTVFATYYNDREPGYTELIELVKTQRTKEDCSISNYLFLLPLDITSKKSIQECSDTIDRLIVKYELELFCLVNNAATASDGPFAWTYEDEISRVIQTNLLGCLMMTRKFIFRILKSKGRVVNVSSGIQSWSCHEVSVYGASKAGVRYFTEALDLEIRKYGASARCVLPGNLITNTNMICTRTRAIQSSFAKLSEEESDFHARSIHSSYNTCALFLKQKMVHNGQQKADKSTLLPSLDFELDAKMLETVNNINHDNSAIKIIKRAVFSFSGASNGREIEKSGVLVAFDDAIRLINCPIRMYAGNFIYTNFTGPIADFVPAIILNIVGRYLTRFAVKN